MGKHFLIVVAITIWLAQSVRADVWSFQGLGDLTGGPFQSAAFDVSDDATAVVGNGVTTVDTKAFRWTQNGGMIQLENSSYFSHSSGISADGSVAVGWIWDRATATVEAFRWTAAGGAVGLGDLPGGTFESYANDVSADGDVIVGQGQSNSGYEAMRWSEAGGMVGLGDLPGGITHSAAFGVSRDGSVVVGEANSASGHEAFLWTSGTGMIGLGDLPGGTFDSHAEDVLADGNVVVGYGNSGLGREAFRWTLGGGMVGLDDLPGGTFDSAAWGGTADGSIIVGSGNTGIGREAFIWDSANGMRNLKNVLTSERGVDLAGWTLTYALAMSPTGDAIVGWGLNPSGQQEAWLVHVVPEPSAFVLAMVGLAGIAWFCRRHRSNTRATSSGVR